MKEEKKKGAEESRKHTNEKICSFLFFTLVTQLRSSGRGGSSTHAIVFAAGVVATLVARASLHCLALDLLGESALGPSPRTRATIEVIARHIEHVQYN